MRKPSGIIPGKSTVSSSWRAGFSIRRNNTGKAGPVFCRPSCFKTENGQYDRCTQKEVHMKMPVIKIILVHGGLRRLIIVSRQYLCQYGLLQKVQVSPMESGQV